VKRDKIELAGQLTCGILGHELGVIKIIIKDPSAHDVSGTPHGVVCDSCPTQIGISPSSHIRLRCFRAFQNPHGISYA
jgi:hypothetical protein